MTGYINGYDFANLGVMKYFSPPSSWTAQRKNEETRTRIFSGDWIGSQKRDGALYVFLKDEDGNITLRGRARAVNGEYIDKWDHLPHLHEWAALIPNGTCFLGEVYWRGNEGSKNTTSIMNCLTPKAIARQAKDENKMIYYIFDCLAFNGEKLINHPASERFSHVRACACYECKFVEYAEYLRGEEIWTKLTQLLDDGYEGMVLVKANAPYEPDKRPSATTLKIKKEIKSTIDCFFTGRTQPPTKEYSGKEIETWKYWEDMRTGEKLEGTLFKDYKLGAAIIPVTKPYFYGWAGSLEIGVLKHSKNSCRLNGITYSNYEVVSIGWLSGLSDEIKANVKQYSYRPLAVTAMEIYNDGVNITLRHGKLVGFRDDIPLNDCTYEKI